MDALYVDMLHVPYGCSTVVLFCMCLLYGSATLHVGTLSIVGTTPHVVLDCGVTLHVCVYVHGQNIAARP